MNDEIVENASRRIRAWDVYWETGDASELVRDGLNPDDIDPHTGNTYGEDYKRVRRRNEAWQTFWKTGDTSELERAGVFSGKDDDKIDPETGLTYGDSYKRALESMSADARAWHKYKWTADLSRHD